VIAGEGASEVLLDRRSPVPHDDDDLLATGVERRAYHMVEDGQPRNGMHDLGERALHARPLSGGEDDGGDCVHGSLRAGAGLVPSARRPASMFMELLF